MQLMCLRLAAFMTLLMGVQAFADPLPHPAPLAPVAVSPPAPPPPLLATQALVGIPTTGAVLRSQILACRQLPIAQRVSRFCVGWPAGVLMGMLAQAQMDGAQAPFCLSPAVTPGSMDQAVLDLLAKDPTQAQQPAMQVMITALQTRFPCQHSPVPTGQDPNFAEPSQHSVLRTHSNTP